MRVIGGRAGGRKLAPPRDRTIRPTSDRVKEAIFNILSSRVSMEGIAVLDICAGTGALGIEALSRGAASAVFVDNSRAASDLVRHNLEVIGLASSGRVITREAGAAIERGDLEGPFELVFLDPPYAKGFTERIVNFLAGSDLIHEGSIVVAEFSSRETMPDSYGRLKEFDRRTYGDTAVSFLRFDMAGS